MKYITPIDIALDGIVIDFKSKQPEKAESPIDVTLVGIAYLAHLGNNGKQTSVSKILVKRIPSFEI